MSDEDIIELYWQRKENAVVETEAKYGSYCRKIAMNILYSNEDAEECVNDTYLHAWDAMPPQRPSRLKLYLAKITRNLAFDRYKAQAAKKRGGGEIDLVLDELGECIVGNSDIEKSINANELQEIVNSFLRSLPERDCNVFLRRYFYSESIAETAKRYGLTPGNVTVILSRTRSKLKKHLIEEGFLDE